MSGVEREKTDREKVTQEEGEQPERGDLQRMRNPETTNNNNNNNIDQKSLRSDQMGDAHITL